jgi:hypothetical protein
MCFELPEAPTPSLPGCDEQEKARTAHCAWRRRPQLSRVCGAARTCTRTRGTRRGAEPPPPSLPRVDDAVPGAPEPQRRRRWTRRPLRSRARTARSRKLRAPSSAGTQGCTAAEPCAGRRWTLPCSGARASARKGGGRRGPCARRAATSAGDCRLPSAFAMGAVGRVGRCAGLVGAEPPPAPRVSVRRQ